MRKLDEDTTLVTMAELQRTDCVTFSLLQLIPTSKAPSLMLLRFCTATTARLSNTLIHIVRRLSAPTEESNIRREGQAPPLRCSYIDLASSLPAKDDPLDPRVHRRDDTDDSDTCLYKDADHRHARLTQEWIVQQNAPRRPSTSCPTSLLVGYVTEFHLHNTRVCIPSYLVAVYETR